MKLTFLLAFISITTLVNAQQTPTVHNLVFEGAGMRGLAYCGAIRQLEEQGIMGNVQRVGGTSAGAITALAVALGYNGKEIEAMIGETNFRKFNDGNWVLFGGLRRFKKYFGWYRHKAFQQWLGRMILAKTGDANITFQQLKEQGGFKELYITGTCLNKQKLMVFSHESFPNMRVLDAVTISMSIPMYFEAVFMTDEGAIVHHPKNKTGLNVMADGGFIANYPIHLFDSTPKPGAYTGTNQFAVNPGTLGLRIDRDAQISRDQQDRQLAEYDLNNIRQYMNAFYTMVAENLNRTHLTGDDWKRTISISDGAIGSRIKKLKLAEIEKLIQNGRSATAAYFKMQP